MDQVKKIPDESIDTIITSPPYWGLRDYGEEGQWGLEPDFHDYLDKMMLLMEELKRVLKKTGTCWVNLGDTYAGGRAHSDWAGADDKFKSKAMKEGQFSSIKKNHIEAKSQYGIPQRFFTLCIDDGWIARNWVTWMKSNAMPFSGNDRLKNMTEPVMFFAKHQKYYFNLDPVRKKDHPAFSGKTRKPINRDGQKGLFDETPSQTGSDNKRSENPYPGSPPIHGIHRKRAEAKKQDNTLMADGKPDPTKKGFNERWKNRKFVEEGYNNSSVQTMNKKVSGGYDMETGEYMGNPNGANPGDVLQINTKPTKEAHFATFPVELPKTILQMACPPDGIVLDPFFGSGTTGIAAEELGLKWTGIELNADYVKIARKRLKPYMSEKII
jgi:site-specific DNA-methyltransferase (cytosine-N4-specific)